MRYLIGVHLAELRTPVVVVVIFLLLIVVVVFLLLLVVVVVLLLFLPREVLTVVFILMSIAAP